MRALTIGVCLTAVYGVGAYAAEPDQPAVLKELDAKISRAIALKKDRFSPSSLNFVKVLWEEYKGRFVKNVRPMNWSGTGRGGAMPKIKSYDEYVGKYGRARRAFLEVAKDEQGRFLVKLEGHTIPAIAWNRGILFTTGDVVISRLPALGGKPHVTLEYFLITRAKGQYVMTSPGYPSSLGRPLEKLE